MLEVHYFTTLSVAEIIQRRDEHETCCNVDCLSKCGCPTSEDYTLGSDEASVTKQVSQLILETCYVTTQ